MNFAIHRRRKITTLCHPMRTTMIVSWTLRDHGKYHENIQKVQKFKILRRRHSKN